MRSFSRLGSSVAFALAGVVSGCGDDEGSTGNDVADAAVSSATQTESSGSTEGSTSASGNGTTEDPASTSADESTAGETSSSVSLADGGSQETEPPTDVDASVSTDTETTGEVSSSETSSAPTGDGGATCGGEGALCCAAAGGGGFGGGGFGGTCDEGLECNNPAGNGLEDSECVVPEPEPEPGDAGSEPECGAEGQLCCAAAGGGGFGGGGFGGTCDEGLECNNPAGNGLEDSECVVPAPEPGDAGSEPECGAEGQLCCASGGGGFGGGGTCDDGLECNNPAGNGLNDSECLVAPANPLDAG